MATDTMAPSDPDDPHWTRAAICRRVDGAGGLSDVQQRLLAAAVRNPDAGIKPIEDEVGKGSLSNVIWRLSLDRDFDEDEHARVLDKGDRHFLDRTLKHRAIIHYLAKHPNARDALTNQRLAERIADETGVQVHWSSVYDVEDRYPAEIPRRRKWLGEDEVTNVEPEPDRREVEDGERTLREKLQEAGIEDLPDHNLDGLTPSHKAREEGRKKGLERAHEDGELHGAAAQNADPDQPNVGGSPTGTWDDADESASVSEPVREVDEPEAEPGAPEPRDGGGSSAAEPQAGDGETTTQSGGERVQTRVGNAGYDGPADGLNLAGDQAPSLLVDRAAADSEVADEAMAALRDEVGEFGEEAYKREVSIEDKEDLEAEIRRLRMVISAQGSVMKAFKQAMDGLSVNVSLEYDGPEPGEGADE